MTAITSAASIVSAGFARFDRASEKLMRATSGASDDDAVQAVAEQIEAKTEVRAGLATVRIADDMLKALIELNQNTTRSPER